MDSVGGETTSIFNNTFGQTGTKQVAMKDTVVLKPQVNKIDQTVLKER